MTPQQSSKPAGSTRFVRLAGMALALCPLLSLAQLAESSAAPAKNQAMAVTPASSKTGADSGGDETLVLSPFVVNTEAETGFMGSRTLAGNRINTDVTAFGSSIAVYTKELLGILGATNSTQLFNYAVSMEGAGVEGNFSGQNSSDGNLNFTLRESPQSQARVRGLFRINYTRNSYITSIPIDSYNIGSVTVNRGPNAVIAGVGEPSGVVDNSLVIANLKRNAHSISFRYGNNDATRSVIDLNRAIIPGKLAARLVALQEDQNFNQKPAYEDKRRLFGTATYQPFSKTTLRASFETGNTRANRPLSVLPYDSASTWLDPRYGNRTTLDYRTVDANAALTVQNNLAPAAVMPYLFADNVNASTQLHDGRVAFIYGQPNATSFESSFRLGQSEGGNNGIRPTVFHPTVNVDATADGTMRGQAGLRFFGSININDFATVNGVSQKPYGLLTTLQGFTNFDAFDFRKRMIDSTSMMKENFHAFNASIEQLFLDNHVGIELSRAEEDFRLYSSIQGFGFTSNNNAIRIDMNEFLPNGLPNPNVGRPFAQFQIGSFRRDYTKREVNRATAFAKYDFKELSPQLGYWLGNHTVTGVAEQNERKRLGYATTLRLNNDDANRIYGAAAGSTFSAFNAAPAVIVYLGPSVKAPGSKLQLNQVSIPALTEAGFTANTRYFEALTTGVQGDFVTQPTRIENQFSSIDRNEREIIKSRAFNLQSDWIGRLLTTTLAWRRDEDFFQKYDDNAQKTARAALGIAAIPDANVLADRSLTTLGFDTDRISLIGPAPLRLARETKAYSAVLRWPQKLLRLPAGTDLSLFYNDSENFSPQAESRYANGTVTEPLSGKTKEYGFNLRLLHDKLFLRLNHFKTEVTNNSFNANGATNGLVGNVILQTIDFWRADNYQNGNVTPTARATAPTPSGIDRTADINQLISALPAGLYTAYNATRDSAGGITGGFTPPTYTDTSDVRAKGNELEIEARPTSNWNIIANVAKVETVQTNIAPYLNQLRAGMNTIMTQLANRPRGSYGPGGSNTGITLGDFLLATVDAPLAQFNALNGQITSEQAKWSANIFANYTFARESMLKGWSAGAGARWKDKAAIGYPARIETVTPATGTPFTRTVVDITHPYYAKDSFAIDAVVTYRRKVWNDKINWKVQLNANNIIAEDGAIPIRTQVDGSTAIARIPVERRWYITNTFEF